MKMHEWIATESAPEAFPAKVISGELMLLDGKSVDIPDGGVSANGWGSVGSIQLLNDPMHASPTELRLTYFSYAEDRFYRGAWPLPTARMAALFAQGAIEPDSGERIEYDTIIVGMAPGGAVALWMSAGYMVVEIAAFRAAPADLPWTLVLNNPAIVRAEFVRKTLGKMIGPDAAAALIANGPPAGMWERRHTRYPLDMEVSGDGTATELTAFYWNGELEPMIPSGGFPPRDLRPAPSEVRVEWTDATGARHGARVTVDEAEIYAALGTLSGPSRSEPVTLDLRIEPGGRDLRATLRTTRAALRLRDATIRTFRRKD